MAWPLKALVKKIEKSKAADKKLPKHFKVYRFLAIICGHFLAVTFDLTTFYPVLILKGRDCTFLQHGCFCMDNNIYSKTSKL